MQPLLAKGKKKVYIFGPGHMTKMAAIVKSLKSFFLRTAEPIALKLGMSHLGSYFFIVYVNDDPGLTLTYFMARSNLVP